MIYLLTLSQATLQKKYKAYHLSKYNSLDNFEMDVSTMTITIILMKFFEHFKI